MTHAVSSIRRRFVGKLVFGGLASSMLLATGCSKSSSPQGVRLPSDATLLCLGDSLTFGYGAASGASYPQQLETLTGHVTKNAGLNGDTAEGALARLPELLQQNTPGLVLVSIGANDFLRGLPVAGTKAALLQIVRQIKAVAGVQAVLVGQPRPVRVAAFTGSLKDHEVYAEVAAETGVALFAGAWSAVLSDAALRSDEIHANAAGYRVFAERLAGWLRERKFLA